MKKAAAEAAAEAEAHDTLCLGWKLNGLPSTSKLEQQG